MSIINKHICLFLCKGIPMSSINIKWHFICVCFSRNFGNVSVLYLFLLLSIISEPLHRVNPGCVLLQIVGCLGTQTSKSSVLYTGWNFNNKLLSYSIIILVTLTYVIRTLSIYHILF